MLRFVLRLVVLAIVLGVVAAFFFGYRWGGTGVTRRGPTVGTSGSTIDSESARRAGAEIADKVAEGADRAGKALSEARLTAKIKSKMTLDDTIDSGSIEVDTRGTVVTVRGSVGTKAQHQRVLQLARETAGVTSVVDRVEVKGR